MFREVSPTERISTSGQSSLLRCGNDADSRVGFKPPATISQEQKTAKYDGSEGVLATKGRHDPCVVPRAVPIVETMAALVVMESVSPYWMSTLLTISMLLQQNARVTAASLLPPLSHLPPTMVLPGTRAKMAGTIANGDDASKKDVVGSKTE